MILIENTVISEDILEKNFICHVEKCKGACCVEGQSGAPLLVSEIDIIAGDLHKIAPFMDPAYLADVEENGFFETDKDGDQVTRCQPTGECNFVVRENGKLSCAIEKAHFAGETAFRKPVSCHLYPVRVKEYKEFIAVNYDRWDICNPACSLGNEMKMPIYKFVKEALVRRFGEEWYRALEASADHI